MLRSRLAVALCLIAVPLPVMAQTGPTSEPDLSMRPLAMPDRAPAVDLLPPAAPAAPAAEAAPVPAAATAVAEPPRPEVDLTARPLAMPDRPPAVEPPRAEAPADPLARAVLARLGRPDYQSPRDDRVDRAAILAFYEMRGGAQVWMTAAGLSAKGQKAIAELRRADDYGLRAAALDIPAVPAAGVLTPEQAAETEVRLSLSVLRYARHARGGRIANPPEMLGENLDRIPRPYEPKSVLERIADTDAPDRYLRFLHPRNPQFERLRQLYLAMRRSGEQPEAKSKAAETADAKAPVKPAEKAAAEPAEDTSSPAAKRRAAARPVPVQGSARKVLLNMEMWRWMPDELGDLYVWVNVPEFMIRVVKGGKIIHAERVIAGKIDTQTPIFSDEMETVVFHPQWGVPDSIKVKEILPSLRSGTGTVLAKHNLKISLNGRDVDPKSVDWRTTDIRRFNVYQPPGKDNVLGELKFLFPNKHQVYMHDTPTRSLFSASVRTFSHGCMRVQNPRKLAEVLLAADKGWSGERIAQLLATNQQNQHVTLSRKIPVHITYFTSWVDDDGKARHFADVYKHEEKVQLGLEGKSHLIVKKKENLDPFRSEPVAQLAETQATWKPADFFKQVFGGN